WCDRTRRDRWRARSSGAEPSAWLPEWWRAGTVGPTPRPLSDPWSGGSGRWRSRSERDRGAMLWRQRPRSVPASDGPRACGSGCRRRYCGPSQRVSSETRGESVQIRKGRLLGFVLGQPLLAPALGFALLILSLQAGFLVEPAALELPEQPFAGQLLLGDLQGLLDVVVENLDFHPANPRPLPSRSETESSTEARRRARASLAVVSRAGLRYYPRACTIVPTWHPFTGQMPSAPSGAFGCSGLSVGW